MSTINQDGMVLDPKVILKRFLHIEHGALSAVRAVVVHQTDIELIGRHIDSKTYQPVTQLQNQSLQWLVGELYAHFGLGPQDVYKHPEVSYKHPGEARSAAW